VVATDVGSVSESILEGKTGHLVASGDVEGMAEAVESLLASPEKRQRMGAAGREHVQQTGSLDAMVQGYQELVTTLYEARMRSQIVAPERPRISQTEEVIRLR
jgi:glycosyltransferase involved in cell wall biosynthesis